MTGCTCGSLFDPECPWHGKHAAPANGHVPGPCVHHPERASITNLDGEDLCRECANLWVRGEGDWAHWLEEQEKDHGQ